MMSHSCVSLILQNSQTQIHWSCSSHGENCIPNLILYGEILEGYCKQGRPKKSFREGLKNDLHKFDIWGKYSQQNTFQELLLTEINGEKWSTRTHKYFRKTGEKIKSKRAIQEKKTQNIKSYCYMCCLLLPTHGWKIKFYYYMCCLLPTHSQKVLM